MAKAEEVVYGKWKKALKYQQRYRTTDRVDRGRTSDSFLRISGTKKTSSTRFTSIPGKAVIRPLESTVATAYGFHPKSLTRITRTMCLFRCGGRATVLFSLLLRSPHIRE